MTLIFCSSCGHRQFTLSKTISQEICDNCYAQGNMKELRLNPENLKHEVKTMNTSSDNKDCESCTRTICYKECFIFKDRMKLNKLSPETLRIEVKL
jgi:hypothetical protein